MLLFIEIGISGLERSGLVGKSESSDASVPATGSFSLRDGMEGRKGLSVGA